MVGLTVTRIGSVAFSDPDAAWTVTEPTASALRTPAVVIVATEFCGRLQVVLELTSLLLPSLYTAIAPSWITSPTVRELPGATMLIDCRVGGGGGGGGGGGEDGVLELPPPQLARNSTAKTTALEASVENHPVVEASDRFVRIALPNVFISGS